MKKYFAIVGLCFAACLATGCAHPNPPRTVEKVDLTRYSGTWYEIARFEQWFQIGCDATTATYTLRPDGKVDVLNRCFQGENLDKPREAKGVARSTNPPENTKLKVMFSWPFEGDYWVFRLSDDYSTAAVGSPDRSALWILHRKPQMDESEYQALLKSLESDGFEIKKLRKARHP